MNSGSFKLVVSKPCLQDWEEMQQTGRGRHCLHCNEEVIDFTLLPDRAIQDFFINSSGAPVCGRFKNDQLSRIVIYIPAYIFQKRIPAWKKYLIILLLCFGKDLFPVNIIFGTPGNLYAQTATPRSNIHKHRKNKYSISGSFVYEHPINVITAPGEIMDVITMGMTITPVKNYLPAGICGDAFVDTNVVRAGAEGQYREALDMSDKKKPKKEKPAEKDVCVLPAVFTRRRKR